jgi:hypothetical protein
MHGVYNHLFDDPGCKVHRTFKSALDIEGYYTDLAFDEYSQRYPEVCTHAVATVD